MMEFGRCCALLCLSLCVVSSQGYDVTQEIEELRAIYGDDVPYLPEKGKAKRQVKRFLFGAPKPYCHEKLGCFAQDGDFSERPVSLPPNSRETVNTQFTLFTRANKLSGQRLRADESSTLTTSHFSNGRQTKFIIHGFLESTTASWFQSMNDEFLQNGDYNIINVDWGSLGASKTLYTQATANTRVVAREISYLIRTLQQIKGLKAEDVHLIGHSLGSHIAGYVGKNLSSTIGRISGLDPAEPYFQGYNRGIRLDPSDAKFVDVLHSDSDSILEVVKGEGGFGSSELSGHADFFPNGGEDQPNCKNGILSNLKLENSLYEGLKRFVACDHDRAIKYYTESINKCSFTGILCSSFQNYEDGNCPANCNNRDQCNSMGFHAHKPSGNSYTKYYLHTTGDDDNFCTAGFLVKVKIEGSSSELAGSLDVTVTGKTGKKQLLKLNKDSGVMKAGKIYTSRFGLSTELGEPIGLEVAWTHSLSWWKIVSKACGFVGFCTNSIKIDEIELVNDNGNSYYFCGADRTFSSGEYRYMYSRSKSCMDNSMLVGR